MGKNRNSNTNTSTTEVVEPVESTEETPVDTQEPETTPEVVVDEQPEVTPEVIEEQPEETPEETPEEKPETQNTGTEDETPEVAVNSWDDVKSVIAMKTSVDNKLEILSTCGFKPVELFVAFYMDYGKTMGPKVNEQEGARFNTRLYNNLITTLREQDDAVFKIKFDLINLIFRNGAKDAFNEFRLCRFSDLQKISEKQLTTYHRLVVLIFSLADASTRAKNKKPLAGFSASNTELNDNDVSRLKRYYEL
jgi:hypothetical protein